MNVSYGTIQQEFSHPTHKVQIRPKWLLKIDGKCGEKESFVSFSCFN